MKVFVGTITSPHVCQQIKACKHTDQMTRQSKHHCHVTKCTDQGKNGQHALIAIRRATPPSAHVRSRHRCKDGEQAAASSPHRIPKTNGRSHRFPHIKGGRPCARYLISAPIQQAQHKAHALPPPRSHRTTSTATACAAPLSRRARRCGDATRIFSPCALRDFVRSPDLPERQLHLFMRSAADRHCRRIKSLFKLSLRQSAWKINLCICSTAAPSVVAPAEAAT